MKSAEAAIKVQYVIMGAIALSLVSIFGGSSPTQPEEVTWFNPSGEGFAAVFAVFFPAVTGIMAGVSMSGDLKDPRKALPKGTLLAVAGGFIVYSVVPIGLHGTGRRGIDREQELYVRIRAFSFAHLRGCLRATLSSALGSIPTAPRTLQALAMDGIVPRLFSKGSGPSNEPRAGILFSYIIGQGAILLGSLDDCAHPDHVLPRDLRVYESGLWIRALGIESKFPALVRNLSRDQPSRCFRMLLCDEHHRSPGNDCRDSGFTGIYFWCSEERWMQPMGMRVTGSGRQLCVRRCKVCEE